MTSNISIRLLIASVMMLVLAMTDSVHGFGARRNYHSYHHLSQKKQAKLSKPRPSAKSSARSSARSSSTEDETEELLERAARIREISAQFAGPLCIRQT